MINPELNAIAQLILEQNYQSDEPILTLIPLNGGEWAAAYKYNWTTAETLIREWLLTKSILL